MFDAAFVGAFFFHDFVEERDVEGDDGDGRACLGDEGFVDGDEGVAVFVGKHFGDVFGGLFEVFFGFADGAVFVDIPGDFGADVGVGDSGGAWGEEVGVVEFFDPEFPVLAAHDFDGGVDFFLGGGLDGDVGDDFFIGIEGFAGERFADGFEDGLVGFAGIGIGFAGGGEAVNDQVDGTHFVFEGLDDLFFDVVRKGVAINAFCVKAGVVGGFFEGDGVVPSGGGRLVVGRRAFEEDAEGIGFACESGGDLGGEAVAC